MLEVGGGIRTKWQTQRGGVYPLRLWTQAEKSWAVSGPDQDSPRLVRELGCVTVQVLVWSSRLEQEEFFKKKKKKRHSAAVWGIVPGQPPLLLPAAPEHPPQPQPWAHLCCQDCDCAPNPGQGSGGHPAVQATSEVRHRPSRPPSHPGC